MNLIYVWVKNYKPFKDKPCSINLSSDYIVTYDERTNKLSILNKKSICPATLFPEDNYIYSYSIIIGDNGAGKTSAFKFLFDKHSMTSLEDIEYIFLFKDEKKFFYYSNINGITIDSIECNILKDSFLNFNYDTHLLYYSPVFSLSHSIYPLGDNQTDISTSYLLIDDAKKYMNSMNSINNYIMQTAAHQRMENRRIIDFMISKAYSAFDNQGITLPTNIQIYARDIKSIIDEETIERYDKDGLLEKLIQNVSDWLGNNKNFKSRASAAQLLEYISAYYKPTSTKEHSVYADMIEKALCNSCINKDKFQLNTVDFFSELKKQNENYKHESEYGFDMTDVQANLDFIKAMDKAVPDYHSSEYHDINITNMRNNQLNFLRSYFDLKNIKDFLTFEYVPIPSAGELSYLTFYARLYDVLHMKQNNLFKKNIIICLDEFETTLHPALQRKAVYEIMKFLNIVTPIIFKEPEQRPTYQLIFATHSPLLLSDFPEGTVTHLKKNEGTVIARQNTFAANIYDLYRNSFFLDFSIGEFSRALILKAINTEDKEESEIIINEVSDPILKRMIKATRENKKQKEGDIIYDEY